MSNVYECNQSLDILDNCNDVALLWVPAHSNFIGYEKADELSVITYSMKQFIGPYFAISFCKIQTKSENVESSRACLRKSKERTLWWYRRTVLHNESSRSQYMIHVNVYAVVQSDLIWTHSHLISITSSDISYIRINLGMHINHYRSYFRKSNFYNILNHIESTWK